MANPANAQFAGISFPPRRQGKAGFWAVATDEELIKESIFVILNTRKGEMFMNPAFGTSIDENVFDSLDKAMQGIICQQIQHDIETWEPRVRVSSIKSYSYENTRMFDIQLVMRNTGRAFSTSVPFKS